MKEKPFNLISIAIVGYFIVLYLLSEFEITLPLMDVVVELFTIPLILVQLGMLVLGIIMIRRRTFVSTMSYICVTALGICTALIIWSFL